MDGAIYTLQEAAERLHMPYRTLRDAVFAERWPHRKISQRRRLMTESDLAAVLEMTAAKPVPSAGPSTVEQRRIKASIKGFLDS